MTPADEARGARPPSRRVLYGRRQGRRLRPGQSALVADFLPRVEISELPENRPFDPRPLFTPDIDDVWLEIGFGGGEHLAAQASAHPYIGFIGCEPFLNGVARLLGEVEKNSLTNVRVFTDDARQVLDALPDASIDRCFILFPDPWPKRRHQRRRIVSPKTLSAIARVLTDGALLRMASDHRDYIRWMLFHTLGHDAFEWLARKPADWRQRPADWLATRYEEKAAERGVDSIYLEFQRRPRQ
jgi:tRNA (guanine-N7-)-methyltransferase